MSKSQLEQRQFKISGMKCASCVTKIENSLKPIPGVKTVEVNLITNIANISVLPETKISMLINAINSLGFSATPFHYHPDTINEIHVDKSANRYYNHLIYKTFLAAGVAILLMVLNILDWIPSLNTFGGRLVNLTWVILAFFVLSYSGHHFFIGAKKAFHAHYATMDTLIALGTGMAWLYSLCAVLFTNWFPLLARHTYIETSIMIVALVNLGSLLELRARRHSANAINKLIGLQPKTARVVRENQEIDIAITALVTNDIVRVRVGERIPADGIITEGHTNIDESMLTGEAMPVYKQIGDNVIGGTVNKTDNFFFKVNHIGTDTVLARIIALVQHAQSTKPPLARLADQVSAVFVPCVMIIALITALFWFNMGPSPQIIYMLITAMAVLVISCPCAIGLAIPISIMLGIGKAAEKNILIRQADALQQAGELTTILLDKTGTITEGAPAVTGIYPMPGQNEAHLLIIAASLEKASEHPIASAILATAKERNLELLPLQNIQVLPGRGLKAIIEGRPLYLGNVSLMQQQLVELGSLAEIGRQIAERGETPVYLGIHTQCIGIIAIADTVKPDAKAAIARLYERGLNVIMITGDHENTALTIAAKVGINKVIAQVQPDEKADYITKLQNSGEIVGMVGDGINDAPALAQADVGFALGTGTDVAMESAGITLMHGSLDSIADAIIISQKTVSNMKQNLFGAFIYNIIGIPLAAGLLYPLTGWLLNPMIAGAAMALSSLTVVMNANRLRFLKMKRKSV